jgi:hypothetical protein
LDIYQSVIASSRYARYIPELKRRETWEETVDRMVTYLKSKTPELNKEFKEDTKGFVKQSQLREKAIREINK